MDIIKPFNQYDAEEQIAACREMASRWKKGARLLRLRQIALTATERTAINTELSGLATTIVPDTTTLLG